MAITIKRDLPKFEDKLYESKTKFYNLVGFSGLNHNHNLFEVDQASFVQSNNIYLNRNKTLISRPPIVSESLPRGYILTANGINEPQDILYPNYKLIDIVEVGKIVIYVGVYNNKYQVSAYNTDTKIIQLANETPYNKYHISVIDNYIIVFNDIDALVLNISEYNNGWSPLRNMVDIPITKRIIGQNIFEYPADQFTNSYKEEYIWSSNTLNILPEDKDADIIVGQTPKNQEWFLEKAGLNTEHRLLRAINVKTQPDDIILSKVQEETGQIVVAIARSDHVLISLNSGISFERVLYPQNQGYSNIAGLSESGLYFFFVAQNGVFRYPLSGLDTLRNWKHIETVDGEFIKGTTINTYSFWYDESFAFVTFNDDGDSVIETHLYFKHYLNDKIRKRQLNYFPNIEANIVNKDLAPTAMKIENDLDTKYMNIAVWLPGSSTNVSQIVWAVVSDDIDSVIQSKAELDKPFGTITKMKIIDTYNNQDFWGVTFTGLTLDENNRWWQTEITIGSKYLPNDTAEPVFDIEYLYDIGIDFDNGGGPLSLENAYIINKTIHSVDGVADLPTKKDDSTWLINSNRTQTVSVNKYYFIVLDGTIYTNIMDEENNVSIIYTELSTDPYNKVPDISHSTTELYLAFGNDLKITANFNDGANYKFSLPSINNHSFVSTINGIINVSTTEVAIFLKNKIYVNTKVQDEVLGIRYDYNNTRLSLGIRQHDGIINTNDGMFTIYPTIRGLAALNYQPDVANTDQIVNYLSDKITDTWHEFYNENTPIKLTQNEHYIILSNSTNTYLLLDLRNSSWWRLTSPVPVIKVVAELDRFNIISNGLYKYDLATDNYRDLGARPIEWFMTSQLLHFDATNYFKNIKQIVYQLEESNLTDLTLLSTIRLYRKAITDKEPETIRFIIDGYRTFVKRFNYWKVNLLQWTLQNDIETESPAQLKINGLAIKYEISEEVR